MSRRFCLSKIEFLNPALLSATVLDPWGADDPIMGRIHDGTFDERESRNYWTVFSGNAPPDAVTLDVGAFSGLLSLVAVSLQPDIKVVAFESSTVTFWHRINNIIRNKFDLRVVPVNLAVSSKQGFITFSHAFGIFTISPGESIASSAQPDHTQTVATIPLDLMLEPLDQRPDYLDSKAIPVGPLNAVGAVKIDVEGHELFVLDGGRQLLDRFSPPVICESLDTKAAASLHGFFGSIDYRGILVEHERNMFLFLAKNLNRRSLPPASGRTCMI